MRYELSGNGKSRKVSAEISWAKPASSAVEITSFRIIWGKSEIQNVNSLESRTRFEMGSVTRVPAAIEEALTTGILQTVSTLENAGVSTSRTRRISVENLNFKGEGEGVTELLPIEVRSAWVQVLDAHKESFTLNDLDPATLYIVQIQASSAAGDSRKVQLQFHSGSFDRHGNYHATIATGANRETRRPTTNSRHSQSSNRHPVRYRQTATANLSNQSDSKSSSASSFSAFSLHFRETSQFTSTFLSATFIFPLLTARVSRLLHL